MVDFPRNARSRLGRAFLLALCFAGSLPLTAFANREAGEALARQDPVLAALSWTAIPSCLLIAVLFAVLGNRQLLRWPRPGAVDGRVLRLALIWLVAWLGGAVVLALVAGHWPTYVHDAPSRIGFLVFGPVGEELLFRGIVQERARRVWSRSATPAVLVSTLAFSLHHLFLRTAPEGLLVPQVLFTIPMGLVLARIRERTGSLWPGLGLHVLTNLPFAF